MAGPFAITVLADVIRLNEKRQAKVPFTVFNNTARPIHGRAVIVPDKSDLNTVVADKWFTLLGEAERDFPVAGTDQYVVQISVPPDAAMGNYRFRLDVVPTENPNGEVSQGPTITIEVTTPGVVNHNLTIPRWGIIAIIAGVLLVLAAIVVFVVLNSNKSNASAAPTALTAFSHSSRAWADTAAWKAGPPPVTATSLYSMQTPAEISLRATKRLSAVEDLVPQKKVSIPAIRTAASMDSTAQSYNAGKANL